MAYTAHADEDTIRERYDSPAELAKKVDLLAALVRRSKHMVAFTGAGISTSAGIHDFRGPNGKWTREAKGLQPLRGVNTVSALPTPTHMSLVELQKLGVLKYLISQNCDGLHRRSGFPAANISELHGNSNIEICEKCGQGYFRDIACHRLNSSRDHFTGRFCSRSGCDGPLCEYTIDFGQSLPEGPLKLATRHSRKSDLHLVMGSSLTVRPACTMPELTARNQGALVIVNLQPTPLDDKATIKIHAKTDTVMTMLMKRLGHNIPRFRLRRRFIAGVSRVAGADATAFVRAVDVHDPSLQLSQICKATTAKTGSLKRVQITLHFTGHYHEPALQMTVDLESAKLVDIQVAFAPDLGKWSTPSFKPIAELPTVSAVDKERLQHGLQYTQAQYQYVLDGWCKGSPSYSRADLVAPCNKKCKQAREAARKRVAAAKNNNALARSEVNLHLKIAKPDCVHHQTKVSETKVPITDRPGEFRKVATRSHRQRMQQHVEHCSSPSCVALWNGPWGPFIGGTDGRQYFDLTKCPAGSQLNKQIGWRADNPRA